MAFDAFGQLQPRGRNEWRRAASEDLARTCPFSPRAANEDEIAAARFPEAPQADGRIGRFEAAYVGHVVEGDHRAAGSSGGMVSWTAAELLRLGLIDAVAHVAPVENPGPGEPLFRYCLSRSPGELSSRAKSRYYPVEMSQVLQEIRKTPGRYAIIGLPCFIKAVHLIRREDALLAERLVVTLGLFCGHMKSAHMVDSFAWQSGEAPGSVRAIDFRHKDPTRPANWYTARLALRDGRERREDWWRFVDGDWGAGFFQNPACNFCDDVVAETADMAFGDAWVEPYSSDGRGTNVVIVRTGRLDAIIRRAVEERRLALTRVDAEFVHQTQAAGFRQRREGLALRLATRRRGLMPRKRVAPVRPTLTPRRWAVYRLRALITAVGRLLFVAARRAGWRGLYTGPARLALTVYQALAWSNGRLGRLLQRLKILPGETAAR